MKSFTPEPAVARASGSDLPVTPSEPAVAFEPESTSFTWTWIMGAGTIVAASATTILAIQTIQAESDAEGDQLDCRSEPDRSGEVCSNGRTRALLTNVGWGLTAALGIGAITAFFLEVDLGEKDMPTVGMAFDAEGIAGTVQVRF